MLRKQGYSYNIISEKTGVSKSTLSGWLSKVAFVPNDEVKERIGRSHVAVMLAQQQRKLRSLELASTLAKKDIGTLSKRDLQMLGLGVYIGEGSKSFGITRVVNSDYRVVNLCLRWFKKVFHLTNKNFRVRIHLYPDNDTEKTLCFWSRRLHIPLTQFQKTQVDTRSGKNMFKIGKLPYGTAHVTVCGMGKPEHGVFLQRRINAWIDTVMK